jgi:hypothetical protein
MLTRLSSSKDTLLIHPCSSADIPLITLYKQYNVCLVKVTCYKKDNDFDVGSIFVRIMNSEMEREGGKRLRHIAGNVY